MKMLLVPHGSEDSLLGSLVTGHSSVCFWDQQTHTVVIVSVIGHMNLERVLNNEESWTHFHEFTCTEPTAIVIRARISSWCGSGSACLVVASIRAFLV